MSDNPVPVPAEPVEPLTVAAYVHWTPDSGQVPAPEPGNYYVSVVDSGRTGLLLGPFTQHVTALGWVDACRAHAEQVDHWAAFYAFGTVRMADDFTRPGLFNPALLAPAAEGGPAAP